MTAQPKIPFYPCQPVRVWRSSTSYERIVTNPKYAIEIKYDDHRCLVYWMKDGPVAFSRHGTIFVLEPEVQSKLETLDLPVGTAVDGCRCGPRGGIPDFIAFDLPMWAGERVEDDLDGRRARLEELDLNLSERLPNTVDAYDKAMARGRIRGVEVEGIVCKLRSAKYAWKMREGQEDASWVKIKVPPRLDPTTGRMTPKPPPLKLVP